MYLSYPFIARYIGLFLRVLKIKWGTFFGPQSFRLESQPLSFGMLDNGRLTVASGYYSAPFLVCHFVSAFVNLLTALLPKCQPGDWYTFHACQLRLYCVVQSPCFL